MPPVLVPRQRPRQPGCRRGGSASLLTRCAKGTHGKRPPVILSGFGLGARVIFDCLLVLAEALKGGDMRAAGVIQHVVLMRLPATADPEVWKGVRLVVAGRIVNCYRPNDLVLLIVHRAANMTYGVAGLGEVSCDSVENYDVSGIVHAHVTYCRQTGAMFDLVGPEQCDRAPSVERDDGPKGSPCTTEIATAAPDELVLTEGCGAVL